MQVYIKQFLHHGIARDFYYQLSLTLTLFIFLFISVSVCLSLIIFLTFVSASQKNPAAPSLATKCFAGVAPSFATSHLLYRLHYTTIRINCNYAVANGQFDAYK